MTTRQHNIHQKLIQLQPSNITLEYKILADAAPVYPTAYWTLNRPPSKSEFIKTLYRKKVSEFQQQFSAVQAPQVNSLLEGQLSVSHTSQGCKIGEGPV